MSTIAAILKMIAGVAPPSWVRWLGHLQFRVPVLGGLIRWVGKSATSGVQRIRHGAGAGLLFDNAGGFPGYVMGTTEPEEQAALQRLVKRGSVVFDVGANIGFHAMICARLADIAGAVWAFEPYSESARMIARNALLNKFQQVHVIQVALSNRSGMTTLSLGDSTALHCIAVEEDGDENAGFPVETITLDAVCERHQVFPDVIIIDVEGAELAVLQGALCTLAAHKPDILLELHWKQDALLDFLEHKLKHLGYHLLDVHFQLYNRPEKPLREHVILTSRHW